MKTTMIKTTLAAAMLMVAATSFAQSEKSDFVNDTFQRFADQKHPHTKEEEWTLDETLVDESSYSWVPDLDDDDEEKDLFTADDDYDDFDEILEMDYYTAEEKYEIALDYWYGTNGYDIDTDKCVKYLMASANEGCKEAQYIVGATLLESEGASEYEKELGLSYVIASAEQKCMEAMQLLYTCYRFGYYVERNEAEANYWLKIIEKEEDKVLLAPYLIQT